MTVTERWAAIRAGKERGMTAGELAMKYHLGVRTIYQVGKKRGPVSDKRCAPVQAGEMVLWRHRFIMEMAAAGHGPSYIGAVLRLNHSSVLHHTAGRCKCVNPQINVDETQKEGTA